MNIHERIKRIMDEKGLKASTFAEMVEISPGTISHIFNGRNKPSNETIEKILKAFPDISSAWLFKGEESMYKNIHYGSPLFIPKQGGLFDENNTVESTVESEKFEYAPEIEVKKSENKPDITDIQNVKSLKNTSKKIDKIVFFFNDNTFEIFIPKE